MRSFLSAVALCLCASAPAWAQQVPPAIRAFDIPTLEKLGRAIFVQEQEAALATDALFRGHSEAELKDQDILGWIVDSGAEGDVIHFLGGKGSPQAAYDVHFVAGVPQVTTAANPVLKPAEMAQFSARRLALHNIGAPCSPAYDTVALPDPEGDGWLVWTLAVGTDARLFFIGGHHRFTISKDGNTILRHDVLSLACLSLSGSDGGPGEKLTGQFVTQLVSDTPLETLVWQSLAMDLPLFVATPDGVLWGVERGSMRKLGGVPGTSPVQ